MRARICTQRASLLFELLTGKPPFTGDSAVAVAYQHVQTLPPLPSSIAPDVPAEMDRVVMKALAKNPDDRWPSSAAAMKADLLRAAHGSHVNAPDTAVDDPGNADASRSCHASRIPRSILTFRGPGDPNPSPWGCNSNCGSSR